MQGNFGLPGSGSGPVGPPLPDVFPMMPVPPGVFPPAGMPLGGGPLAAPVLGGGSAAPEPEAAGGEGSGSRWTEHKSKDGRTFWHDSVSRKSTWDKPDDLKSEGELLLSAQTKWKEYGSADGRTYWYNAETKRSMWQMPDEVKKLKEQAEAKWPVFEDKKEAREKLRVLYAHRGVSAKAKWEEASKAIAADPRYGCFAILSGGEKKQVFTEYITQLQRKLRDEERSRRIKARELLSEALASWEGLHPTSKYREFAEKFHQAEWWPHLDERERDDLFQDYMDDFERKYRDERRQHRREVSENLVAAFANLPDVDFHSAWADVCPLVERLPEAERLDKLELLTEWENYVRDCDKAERDALRRKVYRLQRKRRDALIKVFEEAAEDGDLLPNSEWSDTVSRLELVSDRVYLEVLGQVGSTPRELFEEVADKLAAEYEQHKPQLKKIIKENFDALESLSFDDFYETLRGFEDCSSIPERVCRVAHHYLIRKAASRHHHQNQRDGKRGGRNPSSRDDRESQSPDSAKDSHRGSKSRKSVGGRRCSRERDGESEVEEGEKRECERGKRGEKVQVHELSDGEVASSSGEVTPTNARGVGEARREDDSGAASPVIRRSGGLRRRKSSPSSDEDKEHDVGSSRKRRRRAEEEVGTKSSSYTGVVGKEASHHSGDDEKGVGGSVVEKSGTPGGETDENLEAIKEDDTRGEELRRRSSRSRREKRSRRNEEDRSDSHGSMESRGGKERGGGKSSSQQRRRRRRESSGAEDVGGQRKGRGGGRRARGAGDSEEEEVGVVESGDRRRRRGGGEAADAESDEGAGRRRGKSEEGGRGRERRRRQHRGQESDEDGGGRSGSEGEETARSGGGEKKRRREREGGEE